MSREFVEFPKIARLSREIVITEKIDGTNAQVFIGEDGEFLTGSRTRWITPADDNYGFSKWAHDHRDELMQLGPGSHFGEWWGAGIQRRYNVPEKRFSLFNVARWVSRHISVEPEGKQAFAPTCCHVVPILWRGEFNTPEIMFQLNRLREIGSVAAPGFAFPEGIVIWHDAARQLFKKTIEKDEEPKGFSAAPKGKGLTP